MSIYSINILSVGLPVRLQKARELRYLWMLFSLFKYTFFKVRTLTNAACCSNQNRYSCGEITNRKMLFKSRIGPGAIPSKLLGSLKIIKFVPNLGHAMVIFAQHGYERTKHLIQKILEGKFCIGWKYLIFV